MMLSFTYGRPDPESPPLYNGTQTPWEPVSFAWRPEIWDCSRMIKNGGQSLASEPEIPWDQNIREIWVESRKAYEILWRLPRPDGKNPLVRIYSPSLPDLKQTRKLYDIVICSEHGDDLHLATQIAFQRAAVIAHGSRHWNLLAYAKVAVFPLDRLGPLYWLAYAVASGCNIVASDAGATEECLNVVAEPGSWRVVHHGYDADKYVHAIDHLFGDASPIVQTNYVDRTPWVPAWITEEPVAI